MYSFLGENNGDRDCDSNDRGLFRTDIVFAFCICIEYVIIFYCLLQSQKAKSLENQVGKTRGQMRITGMSNKGRGWWNFNEGQKTCIGKAQTTLDRKWRASNKRWLTREQIQTWSDSNVERVNGDVIDLNEIRCKVVQSQTWTDKREQVRTCTDSNWARNQTSPS